MSKDTRKNYETPVEMPKLLVEQGQLLLFYKPAGLPIHPGTPGVDSFTDWLSRSYGNEIAPVHRLDAPVSGLVLCAADRDVRKRLSRMFEARQVKKTYWALVHGRCRRKGIIRKPLLDRRRQRALEATTRYSLKRWYDRCSLLVVRPESGRKHQIRRHLHMIGHGIAGDQRYRTHQPLPIAVERLCLHALRLELPDGQVFECPITERFKRYLDALEASSG